MQTFLKTFTIFLLATIFFSCKKEAPIYVEPSLADVQTKLLGYWKNKYIEQEIYEGNVMVKKTVITSSLNSFLFKSDSSYTSVFETQAPETGTWELLSNSYLRLDKGKPTDRYYHIITLDAHNLVYRGPFDAAGRIKFGYLITAYDFK